MPVRRATMRKKVIENLSAMAPDGEVFLACVHCETGPSPWLNMVLDEIPLVSVIVQAMRQYYFFTLTNTSVVVSRAGRFTNRPKEVMYGIPHHQTQFSQIKKGRVWGKMYFHFPNTAKPARLNFHWLWNQDVDKFIEAFPHAVAVPVPSQG